jgi:hypothetical protein
LLNQPERVSIEYWHDYWVTLKASEDLSDQSRLSVERQRILGAVLEYPATDMVLFLLHTEGSAFPIVWHMLAAKIAEDEGGVEMLLPLVELLADRYEAFSTDSARPELLPHIQERLVPVLNIIQCVGFESVSSAQADFLRGVMNTHGVAYQAA